jgi:hypothetical protein
MFFSDRKVWYNELTAESASQNHPPHAASAAVLKDLIMKTWEKTLHVVQQLPEAIAEANKWNQEWKEWGRNTAEARMTRSVTTHKPHYELHTRKESVVVPGRKEFKTDAGGNVIAIQTWLEAKKLVAREHVVINRARTEDLGRSTTSILNRYKLALTKLEATNEITLTNAQRAYIETMLLGNGWGKIRHGLRRTDTGATAIYIREGDIHIMLFEDGSTTKSYNVPEFGKGSWFFNTKIKRNTKPVEIAAPAFKKTANGALVLQRYAKGE